MLLSLSINKEVRVKKYLERSMVFGLALVFLAGLAYSQSGTTGAIEGKITDEQGTPLPGAEVKLSSPDMIGGVQSKVTSAEGKFRFAAVPRGMYVLEASLTGFTTTKKDDVKVFVGQTITVDLALKIGKLEEEITVRATTPVVDVKDSQMNATNLDKQMLQNVGQEQRFKSSTNLINLAPGVKDDSAMGAASRVSNQWQLDGQSLLTFVGSGADWQYPDMDIIEEAQVSGSGANAEYGNFTGAVLNLITKSGSNTLEGLLSTSYSPLKWNQKNFDVNDPKFSLYGTPPRSLYLDAHIGVGGPIIKDKLWFYASGGFIQGDTEYIIDKPRESEQVPKGFGKLTFQPDRNNRFSIFAEYELFQVFNRGYSVNRPLEATYFDYGPGLPAALNWLHTFSENTFSELKVGYYYSYYDQRPKQGRDVPQRYNYLTDLYSGNYGWWGESESNHLTANATLSHHAEEFIKGSHDFKIGVEFLQGFNNERSGYTGGFQYSDNVSVYSYYDYQYHLYNYAYSYGYDLKANGWRISAFAQDTWKIGDRLTINPGVRWQMQRGYLPNVQDAAVFKPKSPVEFRLGLTLDVFGDHSTALKAHYGRFHESFKTYYFSGADNGTQDWVQYRVMPDGTKVEVYRAAYTNPTAIDPNVRLPYSDQFTVGLERTIMKDASIGVTFIYREYKDFIARVNDVSKWYKKTFTFKDENGQSQTIDVYGKTADTPEDHFLITNPKEGMSDAVIITPKNTYKGLTFTFNKRFSDGWMFHVDYTYSVAKGNMSNSTNAAWGGYYFENPNRQINRYGPLPYDAPHALNVYGTVALPFGFVFSPRFLYQSGYNWTRFVKATNTPEKVDVYIEPRGAHRVPPYVALDLRLEKILAFTQKYRLGLILDAFNIFNRGVETAVEGRVTSANFGKATSVNDPRYFRVGMRFYF
jgi:hypothetical protein